MFALGLHGLQSTMYLRTLLFNPAQCCCIMASIGPFTVCLIRMHPVHSDFWLSEPVDCYVNNLENGVNLSYINGEIKIVAIQKSVLYNDGNLVIILVA